MPLAAFLDAPPIKGTSIQKGREGWIPVVAVTHEIRTAMDPETGELADTRTHGPLLITKHLDTATPGLHHYQTNGLVAALWKLRFFHLPRSGPECNHLTIKLKGARVVSMRTFMPNLTNPANTQVHEQEEVGIIYNAIEWVAEKTDDFPGTAESADAGEAIRPPPPEGPIEFAYDWANEHSKVALAAAWAQAKDAGVKWGSNLAKKYWAALTGKPKPTAHRIEIEEPTRLLKIFAPPAAPKPDEPK